MTRTIALAAAAFAFTLFALAPRAHAQTKPTLALEDLSLHVDTGVRNELASIDGESTAATVLYATAVPLTLLGMGSSTLGFLLALSGGPGVGVAMLVGGAIGTLLGVVGLGIGIGLDVDSGARRGALQRRVAGVSAQLLVAPTPDGVTVGLAGSF